MAIQSFINRIKNSLSPTPSDNAIATYADLNELIDQINASRGSYTNYYKFVSGVGNFGLPYSGFVQIGSNGGNITPAAKGSDPCGGSGYCKCFFTPGGGSNAIALNARICWVSYSGNPGCGSCNDAWCDLLDGAVNGIPLRVVVNPTNEDTPTNPHTTAYRAILDVKHVPAEYIVNIEPDTVAQAAGDNVWYVSLVDRATGNIVYDKLDQVIFSVTYLTAQPGVDIVDTIVKNMY